MSELVKNVKGPSEWFCKNGKDCWYNGKFQVIYSGSTYDLIFFFRVFNFGRRVP